MHVCIRATGDGNASAERVKEELQPGDTYLAAATSVLAAGYLHPGVGSIAPLPSPQHPQPPVVLIKAPR